MVHELSVPFLYLMVQLRLPLSAVQFSVAALLLMAVIMIVGKIMVAKKTAPAAAPAAAAAAPASAPKAVPALATGTAGECKLYNVGDREAAMLMAIVANKLGKPLNTLRFKSMKEVI